MRIQSLEAFGVHGDLLSAWEHYYGPHLLPVQAAAVAEAGVLSGRSVVVCAPTGAGKTFIGEMAALRAATKGQRAVYLVPTKALAEEKYSLLAHIYDSLGLRIIISTRDRRTTDSSLVRGDFDIAICVPEKLRFLLSQSPGIARHIGCVVVDELQLIGDSHRGLCLEVLLAQILSRAPQPQIVGLSAVIDDPEGLANWLGARSVCVHHRPVELRKGVLAQGIFHYQEHNSGMIDQEELGLDYSGLTFAETAVQLGSWLAERGEPTLIFLRDKASTVRLAYHLTEACQLPAAEETQKHLAALPLTAARRQLAELLGAGVAFHNADLQFEDRQVIETGFARGEIGLLCSTSTLAIGVNVPAKNVILDPYHWEDTAGSTRPTLAPLSRADYENMGGRAGRLRFNDDFGRAILLADTQFRQQAMFDRYVTAPFEPVISGLSQQPPLTQLLSLCATGRQATEADLAHVYRHTFTAHQQNITNAAVLPAPLQAVTQPAVDCDLLSQSPISGRLTVTAQGRLCGASGLSLMGFRWLSHWVKASDGEVLSRLAALLAACAAPEARAVAGPLGAAQLEAGDPIVQVREIAAQRGENTQILEQVLAAADLTSYQRLLAAKLTLVLLQWATAQPTSEIEKATHLSAGRLQLCGETVGWLVQMISQIGAQAGWSPTQCADLMRWADCLSGGLPAEALPLYRAAHRLLVRDHILKLLEAGVDSWQTLLELSAERQRQLLPTIDWDQVRFAEKGVTSPAPRPPVTTCPAPPSDLSPTPQPILVMDHQRPDQVIFRGHEIYLRPAEYKLLRALASAPRRCVSYDSIYNNIWGVDEIVEPSQVYWHRYQVVKKLKEASKPGADAIPIITIPRRGYMLDLSPDQVKLR